MAGRRRAGQDRFIVEIALHVMATPLAVSWQPVAVLFPGSGVPPSSSAFRPIPIPVRGDRDAQALQPSAVGVSSTKCNTLRILCLFLIPLRRNPSRSLVVTST